MMQSFTKLFSLSRFGINILDIVITSVFGFYAYEGYMLGLVGALIDLVSFVFSFIIALKWYYVVGDLVSSTFAIPPGFGNAIGFFIVALVAEIALNILLRKLIQHLPSVSTSSRFYHFFKRFDHFLGILPGLASSLIILSFLLTVIISLPSSPFLKQLVTKSAIGSRLVASTALFENRLNDVFGGALNETLNFLTIEPQSNEIVNLRFTVDEPIVDEEAEQHMLSLLNQERRRAGLPEVVLDETLRSLARNYSADMFKRGYFSHYNLEGQSPFDRMEEAGVVFTHAGENLALAPSTELAMQGLMNSPGHRANMLSENFGRIGIGVMDGGIYGKMYTQEFMN